jgi:hypothetical protein
MSPQPTKKKRQKRRERGRKRGEGEPKKEEGIQETDRFWEHSNLMG